MMVYSGRNVDESGQSSSSYDAGDAGEEDIFAENNDDDDVSDVCSRIAHYNISDHRDGNIEEGNVLCGEKDDDDTSANYSEDSSSVDGVNGHWDSDW